MDLIYTLAVGSDAWHQAVLMVQSVRNAGGFTGDIKVFSDSDQPMMGAEVVTRRDLLGIFNAICARSYIGKDMDVSAYSKVMMLDSDIIAIKPVQSFFDRANLSAAHEIGAPKSAPCPFSLPQFPLRPGEPGLNGGTLVGPASEWNSWNKKMWDTTLSIKGNSDWTIPHYDQPVLNHLARTGEIKIDPLPTDWVYFFQPGYEPNQNTKLIHVLPRPKERIMRCIYGLTNRGAS